MPIDQFMARITQGRIPRVPGTAVFLTRTQRDAPPVMVWHLKHNRVLHEKLFVLTVVIDLVPWVGDDGRIKVEELDYCLGDADAGTIVFDGVGVATVDGSLAARRMTRISIDGAKGGTCTFEELIGAAASLFLEHGNKRPLGVQL